MFSKIYCLLHKSLFWIVLSGLILVVGFGMSDSYSARAKEGMFVEENNSKTSLTNNSLINRN